MKAEYTPRALDAIEKAPASVRRAFYKQLIFRVEDMRHPSLRAKEYGGAGDLWQARVNQDWRFYFKIVEETYLITNIIPHPK